MLGSRLTKGEVAFPSEQLCWIDDASPCACDININSKRAGWMSLNGVLASVAPGEASVCPDHAPVLVLLWWHHICYSWQYEWRDIFHLLETEPHKALPFVPDMMVTVPDALLSLQILQWLFKAAWVSSSGIWWFCIFLKPNCEWWSF